MKNTFKFLLYNFFISNLYFNIFYYYFQTYYLNFKLIILLLNL